MPEQERRDTKIALRQAREARGWSREQVAETLATNTMSVYRWESGRVLPSPYYRQKLAALYGQTIEALELLPASSPPVSPSLTAPTHEAFLLPISLDGRLIGREDLLDNLKQQISTQPPPPPLALMGLPGVGKTSLAKALVFDAEIQTAFGAGILWAGLGPTPNVMVLLGHWARTLGADHEDIAQHKTVASLSTLLHALIGRQRILLVIDDVWNTTEALAFHVGGPACATIMTTRFPPIAAQCAPRHIMPVPELSAAASLALLQEIAPEAIRHEPEQAALLAHAVAGLPLALTLVGHSLEMTAVSQQPRRIHAAIVRLQQAEARLLLTQPVAPINVPLSLATPASRSLHAAIALSKERLDGAAQTLLQVVAVFPAKPNSFTETAIQAVAGGDPQECLSLLDALADAGFVESAGPNRYTLHQAIVDFMQLNPSHTMAQQRLLAYFLHFVQEYRNDYPMLEKEWLNIRAAFCYAQSSQEPEAFVQGVIALTDYFLDRGLTTLALSYVVDAEALLPYLTDLQAHGDIWYLGGRIAEIQGRSHDAASYIQQGLTVAHTRQDERLRCNFLFLQSLLSVNQGKLREAAVAAEECREIAQRLHYPVYFKALDVLGKTAFKQGDIARSDEYYLQGLTVARHWGNRSHEECLLMLSLGANASTQNAVERAREYLEQALILARQEDSQQMLRVILYYLGEVMFRIDQLEEAERYLHEGLAYVRSSEDVYRLCSYLNLLAFIAIRQRHEERAFTLLEEALQIAQNSGNRESIGGVYYALSEAAIRFHRLAEAEHFLQEGQVIANEMQHPHLDILITVNQGKLAVQQGRWQHAEWHMQKALTYALTNKMPLMQGVALFALAKVVQANHDREATYRYAQHSRVIFEEAQAPAEVKEVTDWLNSLE